MPKIPNIPLPVVLKGYPRLSETFIAQEILALEQRGFDVRLVSLRHPTDKARHKIHELIQAPVLYLPEYVKDEPIRVLKGLGWCLTKPGFWKVLPTFIRDWIRDLTPNRGRRFAQALVFAREMPAGARHFYAHFLHTPCSVTRYAAMIRGNSFSFSAHAKDIWTSPDWELKEKLVDCTFGVTCTAFGARHLKDLSDREDKVSLLYHGLDLSRFPVPPEKKLLTDGSDPLQPIRILSVGRLVEKKGYNLLLQALAMLPDQLHWRFVHIGGGTLAEEEAERARNLGLDDRIEWQGAQPQSHVIEELRKAELFVLASRIADDGDRDGLPNVLMEAATQKLPILSTRVSAIPEFIDDGVHGRLVEPDKIEQLAEGLEEMLCQPEKRTAFAEAAFKRMSAEFSMHSGIDQLEHLLVDAMECKK